MEKLWATIKKYPEIAGYTGLAILMFVACFVSGFLLIAVVYTVLFAVFLRKEGKILGLILFINCFMAVLGLDGVIIYIGDNSIFFDSYNTLNILLKFFIFYIYVQGVLQKNRKLNFKFFIPLVLFLIYIALPFHESNLVDIINIASSYLTLYVVFEKRSEIDFIYLVRICFVGLVLSSVFGLYGKYSPFLIQNLLFNITETGLIRYQGLTYHSLHLAGLATLLIGSLLVLKYFNKISLREFFIMYIITFIFGYLTISRAFIVTVAICLIIFAVFYIVKHKSLSWMFLITLIVTTLTICLIFFDVTKSFIVRMQNSKDYSSYIPDKITDEWFNQIPLYSLYTRYDIIKVYLYDWSSSLKTIFFGRGISSPLIAGYDAHNLFLQRLWEHGIIGFVFYFVILFSIIDWKKLKNKKFLASLIFIVPFVLFLMIELIQYEFTGYCLTIVLFGWMNKKFEDENNALKQKNDLIQANKEILKNIKLSIIIPVFNGEKFIQSLIDKVLKIELNKEIIVINDGSTDGSLQLLQAYGDQIILINVAENKGVSHARNLGLDYATGDYISFIDVDDDFELDMHSKILVKMLTENADVGMCRYDHKKKNGQIIKVEKNFDFLDISQDDVVKLYLLDKLICAVWASVYKSSFVKSFRFEEKIKIGEDRLFQLHILLNAKKTSFINEPLYHYIFNQYSATQIGAKPKNILGHVEIPNFLTNIEKDMLMTKFKQEFEFFELWSICMAIHMISQWYRYNKKQKNEIKNFIKKMFSEAMKKNILQNKYISKKVKFEFLVIKYLGVGFHLFIFPFYKFMRQILRNITNENNL